MSLPQTVYFSISHFWYKLTHPSADVLVTGWISARVTDRGVQFTSAVWDVLCKRLGILVHYVTPTAYHLQSNGIMEWFHMQLKEAFWARLVFISSLGSSRPEGCTKRGPQCFGGRIALLCPFGPARWATRHCRATGHQLAGKSASVFGRLTQQSPEWPPSYADIPSDSLFSRLQVHQTRSTGAAAVAIIRRPIPCALSRP